MTIHTLPSRHFRTGVVEGTSGERRYGGRMTGVATDAIARGRHMFLRFTRCIDTVMTGCTGQSVVAPTLI